MVYEDEIWDNQLGDKLVIDGQTSLCSWTNVYARWEDLLQVLTRSPDVEGHCQRDDRTEFLWSLRCQKTRNNCKECEAGLAELKYHKHTTHIFTAIVHSSIKPVNCVNPLIAGARAALPPYCEGGEGCWLTSIDVARN